MAVLFVVGSVNFDLPGLLEAHSSWWRPLITFPAHAVLLLSWWQLGPRWRHPLATAGIWSLPMLFSFPLHSRDVYAYAATGWQVAHGYHPYTMPLGDAGQPGLLVGVHWFRTTSVYPSLQLDIFGLISRLTGGDLYWTTVAMRIPGVLSLLIMAVVLPALARRVGVDARLALWAGLVNPIVLVQWIGGVHNDSLMVALALTALLACMDLGWRGWRGLLVGGVLLGLATGIKQSAALFGLGLVAVAWQRRRRDGDGWGRLALVAVVPGVVTVATFLVSSLGWGLGWRNPTAGNPIEATSNAPLSWVASFVRFHEILDKSRGDSVVSTLSSILIAAGIIVVWIKLGPRGDREGRPWPFLLAVLTVACVLGPALQPWYVTWLLPIYAFCKLPPSYDRLWLIGVLAASLVAPLQDFLAPYVSMAVVGVPLWLLWGAWRRRDWSPLPDTAPLDA